MSTSQSRSLAKLELDWESCTRCHLCATATKHVLYDTSPKGNCTRRADVMLIGEGPGEAEDVIGKPFRGPSGRFLRQTLLEAGSDGLQLVFTNLVACRPLTATGNRPPDSQEVSLCSPRLTSLIQIYNPRAIICLGRVPQEYVPRLVGSWAGRMVDTFHPAFLLRCGRREAAQFPMYLDKFKMVFDDVRKAKISEGKN